MQWSKEQDAALLKVSNWHRGGASTPQVLHLFGFAGTGKTTLAKKIREDIIGDVYFATFTGKAAHVLRTKGCHDATTIHSLIYNPRDKSKQRLKQLEADLAAHIGALQSSGFSMEAVEREQLIINLRKQVQDEKNNLCRPMFQLNTDSVVRTASLIIIDECSMVDTVIGEDLMSFGVKILVLGDPAQLPPVKGEGFFIVEKPEIMLTDIHRQAKDSPIIQMATLVREGKRLPLGLYGTSRVVDVQDIKPEEALQADQVIVGRNDTRHATNDRMRALLGYAGNAPCPGEKVVCLRNNHQQGLLNGAIWYVKSVEHVDEDQCMFTVQPYADQDGGGLLVNSHIHHFQAREKELPWWQKKDAEEFDYGYALTCHKAQGSQWDNVMVFDESRVFRQDAAKWLYTAITRAAEIVTVVRM